MATAVRTFFTAMWRTILFRGLASVAFGVFAIAYPGLTLGIVVTIFGLYVLADGLLGLWGLYRGKTDKMSVPGLLTSLAGIAAGIVCLVFPDFALTYVLLLIGLWNVAAGLLQVIGAIALRKEIDHGWLMALGGVLGAALGVTIMLFPSDAAVSIIWLIAGTAILLGLLLVLFAWKLRRAAKRLA
jgi:uncharacterized membrane protein HdeD (DUF308 family)